MYKVLGYCNLHHTVELGPLSEERSLASTPFLGRYAFIDFTLSNFSNSGIDRVGILVKEHQRSLVKHLGNSNVWNTNTKIGTNAILYNEKDAKNSRYNHDVNNIKENDWLLLREKTDYVVVAPVHFVMAINYQEVLEEHIKKGADITVVYQKVDNAKTHFESCDIVTVKDGIITDLRKNEGTKDKVNISLETYVISMKKFEELIYKTSKVSALYELKDLIAFSLHEGNVHGFEHKGYVRCFDSLNHYLEYSLELLDYNVRQKLFLPNWPIYTITNDTPPTKYLNNADVKNSFISNGAIIDGKVENSILSRKVIVKDGAVIKNSIILTDCIISSDAHLEYVIEDKYSKVIRAKKIIGTKEDPVFIKQGDVI
ncbi:MAG: glucose-1-phosphate adenylyltransferase subunit GlgD [Erysipelotrichales bacterium]|nr:glucose-1-phosphate adenylyltransferase subunit GlgD [Erysipelotrichales bacterium]